MQEFKGIRELALTNWQELTGRKCYEFYDDINGAYECNWQNRNNSHVSIFCSLGIWAECLSQLLQDTRYDTIDVSEERGAEDLYSYYNQLLLITSELVDDLVIMYMAAASSNDKKSAKSRLSVSNGYDLDQLVGFINNIVKHKSNNFHVCNHHLPIMLEDVRNKRKNRNQISVGNINDLHRKTALIMPSLIKVIYSITGAYKKINALFEKDIQSYKRIADKYQEVA